MNQLAEFYRLSKLAEEDEKTQKKIKKRLRETYSDLVNICPHSEAVDRKNNLRGMGVTRRCKICGITDYASEGGTPGDEYDYGYPGYPSKDFWSGANVEVVDDKEFDKYERQHNWIVRDGAATKRFG